MFEYILPFLSGTATLERVGGKGANLAELARAGFPVPPGFVVTTDAYHSFVEQNQIQSSILALAKNISLDDPDALENTSAKIRSLFDRGAIPTETANAIIVACRQLIIQSSNHPTTSQTPSASEAQLPVAVRSSATAEDLPGMAFAGQQDTWLNVLGQDAILRAVRKCWNSLWSARAMTYRAHNHIAPDGVALAVVVQEMIASESSGVLFTANPVTGRRDEMVIDASFGLGEAVVSGQVDPDHYVVNPHTWRITERKLGTKDMAIIPRAKGGTEYVSRDGSQPPALSDAQIIELAQMAQRVAYHFGSPQDIEWAWANGQLALLQTRSITSLYPLPRNAKSDDGMRIYVNFNSIQGVTDPFTPIGIDAIRLLFSGVPKLLHAQSSIDQLLPEAGSRLFMDMTDLVRDPRLQSIVPKLLADTDPGAQQTLTRLIRERQIASKRVLTPRRMFALIWSFLPILRRVVAAMLAPDRVYPRIIVTAEEFIAEAQHDAQAAPDLNARLHAMEKNFARAEENFIPVMPTVLPIFGMLPALDRWLVQWLGEKPGIALQLMRGLPNNVTTEMNLRLWTVAQTIRSNLVASDALRTQSIENRVAAYRRGQLPVIAQNAIEEFLQMYGMRAVAEIDLGRARWRDDPTPILQALRSYLEIGETDLAPDEVYRRNKEHAEYLAADLIARVGKTRFGWLRAKLIGGMVRRMRALSGLREVPLFYMVKVLDIYRTALLDSGRELVRRDELACAEDIFFVSLDPLKRFARGEEIDLNNIVAANRASYDRERLRKQMPRVLLSNGEAFYGGVNDGAASGNALVGEAVSPGVAEGRVHVILDPHQARLEPGEILVCPSTDPGWTPLFLTASGLVMEIGGMITHGSIVAREYGIPAVVGVHNATTQLITGDRVRVDGNSGRVTVLDKRD